MREETRYKLISSSRLYDYYVASNGSILKYLRSSYKESTIKGYLHRKRLTVKIQGKEYTVKNLVAKSFMPGYKKGMVVLNIDGNPWNNAVDNLELISQREYNRITGPMATSQRIEVFTPDGKRKVYSSIRKAAKDMYVSYQTILDYMKGSYRSSVLDGYSFRKIN